jgi:N-acetylmuramoyl-L-alanine amidase CwlA
MDKTLISRLFLKLLGYWLSRRSIDILKKIQKIFFQRKKKKTRKSRWLVKKMCLSGVNLDVLTLESDMKVQFANF